MDMNEINAILNESKEDEELDINKDYAYDAYDEDDRLDESTEETTDYANRKLIEASQSVDAIYSSFDKCKSQIDKAINAVLDVADSLEDILVDATAVGGKIEEIVPSHIEALITKLTNIAEQDLQSMKEGGQTSIEGLKDLIGSIPYRDLKPETKEEKIAKISMRPNLAGGPKSAALQQQTNESVEDSNVLNFELLKESQYIGFDPKEDARDDFRELNMGLTGALNEQYVSPVDKGQDLNKMDIGVKSLNEGLANLSSLKEAAGVNDDENMMAAFASSNVDDSFAAINVPKGLK